MKCPNCGHDELYRGAIGGGPTRTERHYRCSECGTRWAEIWTEQRDGTWEVTVEVEEMNPLPIGPSPIVRDYGSGTLLIGDVRNGLTWMKEQGIKVQMCVTSPPYWGLRDYGCSGQLGLEPTPQDYIAGMVEIFRLVRDVLADGGVLWLNLGDSYSGSGINDGSKNPGLSKAAERGDVRGRRPGSGRADGVVDERAQRNRNGNPCPPGLKPKDLCMIPAQVAIALRDDGWWLRSETVERQVWICPCGCGHEMVLDRVVTPEIVWHKPNPMPESVRDRPTRNHEMIYLLSKSRKYFYDADAIRTPYPESTLQEFKNGYNGNDTKDYEGAGVQSPSSIKKRILGVPNSPQSIKSPHGQGFTRKATKTKPHPPGSITEACRNNGANARTVWTIATQPFSGSHFATFPVELVKRCILAGSRPGDLILDPFMGSGTTAQVAESLGRRWIGTELNPAYEELITKRLSQPSLIAEMIHNER